MDQYDYRVRRTLRSSLWQIVVGNLRAILELFWNEREEFELIDSLFIEFIEKIDETGIL